MAEPTPPTDLVAMARAVGAVFDLWPDGAGFTPDLRPVADPAIVTALLDILHANYAEVLDQLRRKAGAGEIRGTQQARDDLFNS